MKLTHEGKTLRFMERTGATEAQAGAYLRNADWVLSTALHEWAEGARLAAKFACCGGNDETPQDHCADCARLAA